METIDLRQAIVANLNYYTQHAEAMKKLLEILDTLSVLKEPSPLPNISQLHGPYFGKDPTAALEHYVVNHGMQADLSDDNIASVVAEILRGDGNLKKRPAATLRIAAATAKKLFEYDKESKVVRWKKRAKE